MSDFSGPFVPRAPPGSGAALCRRSPRLPRSGMGTGGGGRSVPRSGDAGDVGCANGTDFPLSPPSPCRIRPPLASTRRPATRPPLLTRRMSWRSSLRRVRASPKPALGDFSSFRAGSCSLVSLEHPSGGGGTSPDSGHGSLVRRLGHIGVWHGGPGHVPRDSLSHGAPTGGTGTPLRAEKCLPGHPAAVGASGLVLQGGTQVALGTRGWPWPASQQDVGQPRDCHHRGVTPSRPRSLARGHRTPTPATRGCPRATPLL